MWIKQKLQNTEKRRKTDSETGYDITDVDNTLNNREREEGEHTCENVAYRSSASCASRIVHKNTASDAEAVLQLVLL